jgi:hypothetical protein
MKNELSQTLQTPKPTRIWLASLKQHIRAMVAIFRSTSFDGSVFNPDARPTTRRSGNLEEIDVIGNLPIDIHQLTADKSVTWIFFFFFFLLYIRTIIIIIFVLASHSPTGTRSRNPTTIEVKKEVKKEWRSTARSVVWNVLCCHRPVEAQQGIGSTQHIS